MLCVTKKLNLLIFLNNNSEYIVLRINHVYRPLKETGIIQSNYIEKIKFDNSLYQTNEELCSYKSNSYVDNDSGLILYKPDLFRCEPLRWFNQWDFIISRYNRDPHRYFIKNLEEKKMETVMICDQCNKTYKKIIDNNSGKYQGIITYPIFNWKWSIIPIQVSKRYQFLCDECFDPAIEHRGNIYKNWTQRYVIFYFSLPILVLIYHLLQQYFK